MAIRDFRRQRRVSAVVAKTLLTRMLCIPYTSQKWTTQDKCGHYRRVHGLESEMSDANMSASGIAEPVMTLEEIAGHLKVSEKTILRMVRTGDLPGLKVSNQWRFLRTAIDDWLMARMQHTTGGRLVDAVRTRRPLQSIPSLIAPNRIVMGLAPGSKRVILRRLIQPLIDEDLIADRARYLSALLDREEMLTTAVGEGVALPHARDAEEAGLRENCIVLGLCRGGADFGSLDGNPTQIFLLIGAMSTEAHLRLMAKATLMLRIPGFKEELMAADDVEEVRELLMKAHEDW